jgi:hypothetical protein
MSSKTRFKSTWPLIEDSKAKAWSRFLSTHFTKNYFFCGILKVFRISGLSLFSENFSFQDPSLMEGSFFMREAKKSPFCKPQPRTAR